VSDPERYGVVEFIKFKALSIEETSRAKIKLCSSDHFYDNSVVGNLKNIKTKS
jgi:dTDP-glucose pyrophosphorylase